MMTPSKWTIKLVLIFIFLLNGCSFLGIDLTETRTIAIQKSPYLIVLDGDIEQKDIAHVEKMMTMLSTQPYIKEEHYNFKVNVSDQTVIVKGAKIKENISIMENPYQKVE